MRWRIIWSTQKAYLSILAAVLTVSPKRQYRGMERPTTPAITGPVWTPARSFSVCSGLWGITKFVLVWKNKRVRREGQFFKQIFLVWKNKREERGKTFFNKTQRQSLDCPFNLEFAAVQRLRQSNIKKVKNVPYWVYKMQFDIIP